MLGAASPCISVRAFPVSHHSQRSAQQEQLSSFLASGDALVRGVDVASKQSQEECIANEFADAPVEQNRIAARATT